MRLDDSRHDWLRTGELEEHGLVTRTGHPTRHPTRHAEHLATDLGRGAPPHEEPLRVERSARGGRSRVRTGSEDALAWPLAAARNLRRYAPGVSPTWRLKTLVNALSVS